MSNNRALLPWLVTFLAAAACGGGGGSTQSAGSGLRFVTQSLPDGRFGAAYDESISVTGGEGGYAWQMSSGTLPPGLVLDVSRSDATTTLRGTPSSDGEYEFSIDVGSGGSSISHTFRVSVATHSSLVDGWTDFPAQPGARVIHVSATGDDSADGSLATPRRTLAGGYALLRDGQPDWLLLKRGDTFPLTGSFQWGKSGPATGSGWMRLGAYGDENAPRPVLDSQGGYIVISPGYQSSRVLSRLAMTDVHLSATSRIANSGTTSSNINAIQVVAISWQGTGYPVRDLLFENFRISGFTMGLVADDNAVNGLTIRRCIFDRIFGVNTGHSSAVIAGAANWLIEDNLFYRVMSPDIAGVGSSAYSGFSHSVYVTAAASNVVSRGNIMIKAPDAVMQRAGGVYSRNVSAHTNIGGNVGQAWGVTPVAGGVVAHVSENLALNSMGGNFFLGNINSGVVESNLLLQDMDGQAVTSFNLVSRNNSGTGVNIGVHNTVFTSNLICGGISYNPGDTASFSGLTFSGNQTNLGPTSTSIANYLQAVGWSGSTVDDWAQHLMIRDRTTFTVNQLSASVINFYREHYALPPLD